MAGYNASVETPWDRETTFNYLADFSSVSDWDPGIPRAECIDGPPLRKGARFEIEFEVFGRSSILIYETVEFQPPERIVLRAETGTVTSIDTMTFTEPPTGGTRVTYDANVKLSGALKLFDPLFGLFLKRTSDRARDGLAEQLAGPPPA